MEIFVLECGPAFDQKSMGIVVATVNHPEPTFGDQGPGCDTGRPDDALSRPTVEIKGLMVGIELNTIHRDLLTDIAGYDVGIVAGLFEVVIELLSRPVRQIEGLADIGADDFFVGIQREEVLMKAADMVAGLYRDIVAVVGSYGLKRLSIGENPDALLGGVCQADAFGGYIAGQAKAGYYCQDGEPTDLPEGGVDVFGLGKNHRISDLGFYDLRFYHLGDFLQMGVAAACLDDITCYTWHCEIGYYS